MRHVTLYDSDGNFGKILSGDDDFILQNTPVNGGVCEGVYSSEDWYYDHSVDSPDVKTKLEIYYTGSIEAGPTGVATIQVPNYRGVTVIAPDGSEHALTDDLVRFRTPEPGQYDFVFTGIPYLDERVTIHAS